VATIIPGILTSDETEYAKRLAMAEHACDLVQIDIVDGKFANNLTVGVDVIEKYMPKSHLEIQLMVVDPIAYIDKLAKLDFVTRIIFPFEIKTPINDVIYKVKNLKKQVGLSLNPDTEIEAAGAYFDEIEILLLMTGKPGFSGQKLGGSTYERIKKVKLLKSELPIEIDIGVNFENAAELAGAGASYLVASSALFEAVDFSLAYERLANLASSKG
jgi:ribulose-phosphate 3-epimerase